MSVSDSYESEEYESEQHPQNMEEWEDKWWLTKKHLPNLKETSDTGYVCEIYDHGNVYDDSNIETKHFKTIKKAYEYVCDYLTKMYNTFRGENLSLFNPDEYGNYPEYEESLADWQNAYFLLNYGSSSGPTPYTITVKPISFE